ncbi:MAG: transcription elongation factor GreA [Deltaproteobacteria bacterium]|nr:transcription elongation factor GreA [Deltaproteobacteria bacterium]
MKELPVLKKLREELKGIEYELRVEVPKELRTAAAHGDFKENSEYDAAKQRQAFLQARVSQYSARINSLASIELDDIPRGVVGFGSKIFLEDINTGDDVTYELVTPEEVDPKVGKISIGSPIGKALMGKVDGDEVSISLPSGLKEYEITGLKTIHELFDKD